MKGGYQILDLTGATAGSPVVVKGIYKAAAGNNGKPVLILTNDGQRVYAEIAEDNGDYITCYISAEGKTVNITIEPDDSVTTVISDPGASITGLEQAVNEIAGNIGDVDDLTTTSKVVVGAVNELNSKNIELLYSGSVADGGSFTIPTNNHSLYLLIIRGISVVFEKGSRGVLNGGLPNNSDAWIKASLSTQVQPAVVSYERGSAWTGDENIQLYGLN